jgi:hypothetical protein
VLKSLANVMQWSTPKAFANDLSHLLIYIFCAFPAIKQVIKDYLGPTRRQRPRSLSQSRKTTAATTVRAAEMMTWAAMAATARTAAAMMVKTKPCASLSG